MDVTLAERPGWSPARSRFGVAAVRALAERRVVASIASPTGNGEVWDASHRWWERRPRTELALSTPELFGLNGRTRIGAAFETHRCR